MTGSRNDVVLLPIPFTDLTSRKVRPTVVVGRNGTDLFLVPISSVLSNTDIPVVEWSAAGLNVPSGIKAQLANPQMSSTRLKSSELFALRLLEYGSDNRAPAQTSECCGHYRG